jgi:hypothetical protein
MSADTVNRKWLSPLGLRPRHRYAGLKPCATAIVMMSWMSLLAFAQWHGYPTPNIPRNPDGSPNLEAPAPRAPDGKPDLSGIWLARRPRFDLSQSLKAGEVVPLQPAAKALFDERRANKSKDDPSARCLPTGLPVRATLATPLKFVQTPGLTVILYESRTTFRQILTDGRPLPKEIDWPSWQGFSIGKWEGETFVIDTTGFNGRAWLDQAGHPESESLHLTERFRRRDFGHMDMEMIIDDPKMYTRPWSIFAEFLLQTDTELLEFICEENERDSSHMLGK